MSGRLRLLIRCDFVIPALYPEIKSHVEILGRGKAGSWWVLHLTRVGRAVTWT